MSAAPQRVLLYKPCCLGDVLLATPLAAAARAAWPEARIDWAVDAHSRPALLGNPDVDGLLDATGCVRGALRPASLARLWGALRKGGYDLALVPDRSPIGAWLCWAAGIPRRVGLDSGGRGRAHGLRVAASPDDPRRESEIYLDLARALGLPAPDPRPVFRPSPEDAAAAADLLASLAPGGPRVALHPGGGVNPGMTRTEKRWPLDRFADVAARLLARDARLVLLGGPEETPLTGELLRRLDPPPGRAVSGAGRLGLGGAAAAIARCDIYLGNDTGVSHLAAAAHTPVLVLFGPTDPARYGPHPDAGRALAPPGARPRSPRKAAGSAAIEALDVDTVWVALEALLAAANVPSGTTSSGTASSDTASSDTMPSDAPPSGTPPSDSVPGNANGATRKGGPV